MMEITEELIQNTFPNLSDKQFFSSREDFNEFMIKIDDKMRKENIPIAGRQIKGLSEVAKALKTELPLVPSEFAKENDYSPISLSAHVIVWLEKQYGDRLKVDFSGIKTICRISGDLYKVNIPLVFAQPKILYDGTLNPRDTEINVGSLIVGITEEKYSRITREEINYLFERVRYGCFLGNQFFDKKEMFQDALGDFKSSVEMLVRDVPLYGQSRWSCLQFVEKSIKAYLSAKSIKFPKVHMLLELFALAPEIQVKKEDTEKIQCSASCRYDSSISNEAECILSHESAQRIVIEILRKWK